MDWSRAKTIFIITFLILDIFLAYQMIVQKNENAYDILKETSIDEKLAADEIQLNGLPEGPTKEFYVEANIKEFIEGTLDYLPNQKVTYINDTLIQSSITTPYPLIKDWDPKAIDEFIKVNVFQGSNYKFWDYNEKTHIVTYYQTYNAKMFYENSSGKLELKLNDDNQIVSYTQTLLEDIHEVKEQEILTAYEAIVILYNKHHIRTGDEITNIELGYRTLVPIQSLQLLAPTWKITINNEENYYVNAVEGHIFQVNSQTNQVLK